MIKLNYTPTYQFSSAEIFDATDQPLEFAAHSRLPAAWAALAKAWITSGSEDADVALTLVGMALVSVSQDGETYPIAGREGAEALRDAIEAASPGFGETFIKHLALGHYHLHFRRLEQRLKN
ncbi:MAG: hypothetical protein BroJett011_04020 [Chloroflexota bacterium]|nr:MAG: hypothetical protein BroJett011_04020 [Chloroflexota bacterium]